MITIGGVVLDSDVIVTGLTNSAGSESSLDYTIGGQAIVINTVKTNVPVVSFASSESSGWQKYDTVQNLMFLEQSGSEVLVDINGTTFIGVFTGGFTAEKVISTTPDGSDNDFYKVNFSIIKLRD